MNPVLNITRSAAEMRDTMARLKRAIAQGLDLAQQVERGQAALPISDHFRDLAAALDADPFTVVVAATPETAPVVLTWLAPPSGLVPAVVHPFAVDPAALDDPIEVARLAVRADVLVLTTQAGPDWTDGWGVRELAALLPTVRVQVGAHSASPAAPGALDLDPAGRPAFAAVLADRNGARDCQPAARRARRLLSACAMLADRIAAETRRAEGRRRVMTRRLTAEGGTDQEARVREATESVRRLLDAGVGRLEAALADRCRARTAPGATAASRIRSAAEDLMADDLVEEKAGHTAALVVGPDCLRRLARVVELQVAKDVGTDVALLREGQCGLAAEAARTVAAATGAELRLATGFPDAPTWDEPGRPIEFRQRSEVPVRGVLDLLGHGRRPLMVVTMTASLVGAAFGVGASLQAWLAPVLLLVFVGSLGWAVFDFRRERAERIEKELRRFREALETEARRVHEQTLRDWQGRAARHLREAYKALAVQADGRLRAAAAEHARRAADDRHDAQEKLRAVEARIRELAGQGEQVRRLVQAAEETLPLVDRGS